MKELQIKEPKIGNVTWEYPVNDDIHTKRFISFMYFFFLFLVESLFSLLFLFLTVPNFNLIQSLFDGASNGNNNLLISFAKPMLVGSLFAMIIYIVISISMSKELQELFTRNIGLKELKISILISVIWIIGSIVLSVIISQFSTGENANQEGLESSIKIQPLVMFLTVVIIGPLMEEIAFRYGIIGSFKNKWIGLAFSTIVFGTMHMLSSVANDSLSEDIITLPVYLWMGLMSGLIYVKTENILYSYTLHLANNLLAFLIIFI